jgi:hypothetical protein
MTWGCGAMICAIAITGVACGSSSYSTKPAATPAAVASPKAPAEGPVESFKILLDAINARDAAGVYARLSSEAKKDLSSAQVQALVTKLVGGDPNFRITIDTAGEPAVNGTQAQFDLTLSIGYQGKQFPLTDVAFMQLEDGQWRLADHFLQTALAAGGLGPPPAKPRVFRADGCVEGDVLAGVYLPSRLKVLEPCVTIEATVREVERPDDRENDGDLSFNLELAPGDQRLLNDVNRQNMHGWLHLEIVPLDRAALPVPVEGERIRVTGPWVTDTVHGHNEIHPVWSLKVLP